MRKYLPKIGVIAGNFDIIHPGYIKMFKQCESNCEQLFILLQEDPSIERPEKLKPILTVEERKEILESVVYSQAILTYNTEAELLFLLKSINPDVRFLGDDYLGRDFTGDELMVPIHWICRDHGWSTTKFKKLIAKEYEKSSNR